MSTKSKRRSTIEYIHTKMHTSNSGLFLSLSTMMLTILISFYLLSIDEPSMRSYRETVCTQHKAHKLKKCAPLRKQIYCDGTKRKFSFLRPACIERKEQNNNFSIQRNLTVIS